MVASWGTLGSVSKNQTKWPTDFSRDITPIPCHSHNDYWRRVPLFDALAAGCTGVEADVWLENDDLLVGHSRQSLTPSRTLRSLYINPLIDILKRQNPNPNSAFNATRNGVFDTKPSVSLTLLVDIKSDGAATFARVIDQLADLRSLGLLTNLNHSVVFPGPITVVGTGNTPFDHITSDSSNPYHDIFFDAPLNQFWGNEKTPSNTSVFSAQNSYYASTSFAKSVGKPWLGFLRPSQVDIIRGQVAEARRRGLKARYFDTPAWPIRLRNHVWDVLVQEGVGMLNVDDLQAATRRHW